jgi:hypothetical protein
MDNLSYHAVSAAARLACLLLHVFNLTDVAQVVSLAAKAIPRIEA